MAKKKKEIPSKLYYSISEIADYTGIKAHVLRYWESEFPTLKPRKTRTGARRYRQPDIDEILAIKGLLYDEGYKIAGAIKMRRQAKKAAGKASVEAAPQLNIQFDGMTEADRLVVLKNELGNLLDMIKALKTSTTSAKPAPKKMKGTG
ncbi:MAG: MerR family transcriptional regulator [Candidatus Krumholzibacteria bacterium]|nr:MerR family transcriptional regulator [Candidatus Krumholzibacteria bacterium]